MEVLYTHKTLEQSVLHTTTAHMFELSVWYKLDNVSDSCFTIVTQSIQVEICRNMVIKDTGSALVDCSQCESVQKRTELTDTHSPLSQSRASIAAKSASPTPTMMRDMGSRDALMMAVLVGPMSVSSPSVNISRMK